jgi:hypothetical protein
MIKKVPARWLASVFGFESKNFFEAEEGAETAPEVNFD